jgi:hypothetical protein
VGCARAGPKRFFDQKTHEQRVKASCRKESILLTFVAAMGWNVRRSINFGPFRFNLSRSGIGYSMGAPGFRIGKDAKGRTYSASSIPGTGLYRRDYVSSSQPTGTQPGQNHPSNAGATAGTKFLLYAGAAVVIYVLIRLFS